MQLQTYVSTSNLLMRKLVHPLSGFLYGNTFLKLLSNNTNNVAVNHKF